MEETLLKLWRFVNYETEVAEFEQWVYATSELEEQLPSDLYFQLISVPYKDKYEVEKLRDILKNWLEKQPMSCSCITWPNHHFLFVSKERPWLDRSWPDFDTLKERSPWLYLIRCKGCGQHWYLFVDEHAADYYLYKMKPEEVKGVEKDIWPRDIDAFNQHLDSMWLQKRK